MAEPRSFFVLHSVSKSWSRVVVLGVIDVIAGLIALVWPAVTVLALALILGFALLMSGIASLSIGIRVHSGTMIAVGVIALIGAILFFAHPGAGVWALALAGAFYFFVTGLVDLMLAGTRAPGRAWWGFLGVVSIVSSFVLLFHPGVAVLSVAVIAGIAFLVRGGGELMTGFRLRAIHKAS